MFVIIFLNLLICYVYVVVVSVVVKEKREKEDKFGKIFLFFRLFIRRGR